MNTILFESNEMDSLVEIAEQITINGGQGPDVIEVPSNTNQSPTIVNTFDDDDIINVSPGAFAEINGGDGFDTIVITAPDASLFGTAFDVNFSSDLNDFDDLLFFNATPTLTSVISANVNLGLTSVERIELIDSETGAVLIYQTSGLAGEVIDLSNDDMASFFIAAGGGNDTIILPDVAFFSFVLGGDGDDIIIAGDGAFPSISLIFGGAGNDILTGGVGADTFAYFSQELLGGFSDTITNFSEDDSIQISSIAGGTLAAPNFISNAAFSGARNELRSFTSNGQTFLELDIDGDAVADETLTISNGEFDIEQSNVGGDTITLRGTSIGGTIGDDDIDLPAGEIDINTLSGDDEINIIDGTTGSIDGGDGFDTVIIRTGESLSLVTNLGGFDLQDDLSRLDGSQTIIGLVDNSTGEQIVNFASIERLVVVTEGFEIPNFAIQLSGADDDILTVPNFNGAPSVVFGNDGDDVITDLGGASSIFGGAGDDILTGGRGADEFSFFADSLSGSFSDTITDFSQLDTIFISSDDSGALIPNFIDDGMFSGAGNELRSSASNGQTVLELDIDGDMIADEVLTIENGEFDIAIVTGNGNGLNLRGTPIGPAVTPGFDFSFDFIDTVGIDSAILAELELVAETALSILTEFISAVDGASLDIDFTIEQGGGFIAAATPTDFVLESAFFNEESGFFEVPVGPQVEFSQGIDSNGAEADIDIFINSDFLLGGRAFLGTDPDRVVPINSVDYVSTIIHEIVHGLGFTSFVNLDGNRSSILEGRFVDFDGDGNSDIFDTTFGSNVEFTVENGSMIPFFTGENLVNVFGEPIVLENVNTNPGSAIDHFAEVNPDGSVAEAADSIESTFATLGSTLPLDAITLAVLQDLGFVVTIPDDTPLISPNSRDNNISPTLSTNVDILLDAEGEALGLVFALEDENNLDALSSLAVEVTAGDGITTHTARVRFNDSSEPFLAFDQDFIDAHLASGNDEISIRLFSTFDLNLENGQSEQLLTLPFEVTGSDVAGITIVNFGTINGDLITGDGDDIITNEIDGLISGDINSNGGNDTIINLGVVSGIISGGAGDDTLIGGAHDDVLNGDLGDDVLEGDAGNDVLNGGLGDDVLEGDAGNDVLSGSFGSDVLFGGTGGDILDGGLGSDSLDGEDGNDTLIGNRGDDILFGGSGDDMLAGGRENDVLFGDNGDDTLDGGGEDDILFGDNGHDALDGGGGADFLDGGLGSDVLAGGNGNDTLIGNRGVDELFGGRGDDILDGERENDILFGDRGDDILDGGGGLDILFGGTGDDILDGGGGDDLLDGGSGGDILDGGFGSDQLDGGTGNDTLIGERGNDVLNGGTGNDTLSGGREDDILFGGTGDDLLNGGTGQDIFVFATNIGTDRVEDFQDGIDLLDFNGLNGVSNSNDVLAQASQDGADVRFEFDASNVVILEDTLLSSIDDSDFIFDDLAML